MDASPGLVAGDGDTSDRLRNLVLERTGIAVRDRDDARFGELTERLVSVSGLPDANAYVGSLAADTQATGPLWRSLIDRLTIRESFFSRDEGQLDALERFVLAEAIARNRDTRTLRIWSAGCATGEETYTLAMAVRRHLPPTAGWRVLIIGTDINQGYLDKATDGRFTEWSFRRMTAEQRARDFHSVRGGWRVSDELRSMVTFQRGNLILDDYPDDRGLLHDMDLILCRNVFIYFASASVGRVIAKMARTLRTGGFLVTGHAETVGQDMAGLVARQFPGTLTYQRVPPAESAGGSPVLPPVRVRRRVRPAPSHSEPPSASVAAHESVVDLLAAGQQAANAGRYGEAAALANRALTVDEFAHEPYLLLATVAELEGDTREARSLLDRALYLDPTSIPAYLTLAALHQREGNMDRARTLWSAARVLLLRLPPEDKVPPLVGTPVQALIDEVEWLLEVHR